MRRIAGGLLLAVGCSSPDLIERDVDPGSAIRVEILDDLVLVDGTPVDDAELREAIGDAHRARGAEGRCAAIVSVVLQQRDGESPLEFEARAGRRKQDVLELLVDGGVRDLQLGPPVAPGERREPAAR